MSSISPTTAATEALLPRAAEDDTEKSAKLLKKALNADKDLVATLLPPPDSNRLDIRA
jgi:hypothetical protein